MTGREVVAAARALAAGDKGAAGVPLCPRHPAAGAGDRAGPGRQRESGAGSPVPPRASCNRAARRGEYSAATKSMNTVPWARPVPAPPEGQSSMTPRSHSAVPAGSRRAAVRDRSRDPAAGSGGSTGTGPPGAPGEPGSSAMTLASSPGRCCSCTPVTVSSPHSIGTLPPASCWSARLPGPSARAGRRSHQQIECQLT
jgi:hypothetical protein